jgi:hypothetical protein
LIHNPQSLLGEREQACLRNFSAGNNLLIITKSALTHETYFHQLEFLRGEVGDTSVKITHHYLNFGGGRLF